MTGVAVIVERSYSALEACRLAGCSYRQMDYWSRLSVLGPGAHVGIGSGGRRRFTRREVELLRLCACLSELNATTPVMTAAVVLADALVEMRGTLVVEGSREAAGWGSRWSGNVSLIIDDRPLPPVALVVDLSVCRIEAEVE